MWCCFVLFKRDRICRLVGLSFAILRPKMRTPESTLWWSTKWCRTLSGRVAEAPILHQHRLSLIVLWTLPTALACLNFPPLMFPFLPWNRPLITNRLAAIWWLSSLRWEQSFLNLCSIFLVFFRVFNSWPLMLISGPSGQCQRPPVIDDHFNDQRRRRWRSTARFPVRWLPVEQSRHLRHSDIHDDSNRLNRSVNSPSTKHTTNRALFLLPPFILIQKKTNVPRSSVAWRPVCWRWIRIEFWPSTRTHRVGLPFATVSKKGILPISTSTLKSIPTPAG